MDEGWMNEERRGKPKKEKMKKKFKKEVRKIDEERK